jgi:hypothetical protein
MYTYHTNDLIQKMKYFGEFTQIKENPLRTYYTCVRYSNTGIGTSYDGFDGSSIYGSILYGPGKWSCMKGWFEMHRNTFEGERIDLKVLKYCKFRNSVEALNKDINDQYTLFISNDTK